MAGTRLVAVSLLAALASACAALPDRPPKIAASAEPAAACRQLFLAADREAEAADVVFPGLGRVDGFPHLRTDRFLASFRDRTLDNYGFTDWVTRLRHADETARKKEIAVLPPEAKARLAAFAAPLREKPDETLLETLSACGEKLVVEDERNPSRHRELQDAVTTPDAYLDWERVLGLYPLYAVPTAIAYTAWRQRHLRLFREPPASDVPIRRYVPKGDDVSTAVMILWAASRDSLGLPRLGDAEIAILARAYAPVWAIESKSAVDAIGMPTWTDDLAPTVDLAQTVAFYRFSHAWFQGRIVHQLSYIIWFPERPKTGWLDPLAGRLDGIVWRVSFGDDGAPIMYDTIHPCGCYHLFFPVPPHEVREGAFFFDFEEPPLSPGPAPRLAARERMVVRIEAHTHYVRGLDVAVASDDAGRIYELVPYERLFSLATPDGERRSLFGTEGIVAGTERLERLFLWPSGVRSPGAMRAWGTHATAFIGRRHFDDADLLDRVLKP